MKRSHLPGVCALALTALTASAAEKNRDISRASYQDKVSAAWTGQVIGAIFGWPFEGKPKNTISLDHYLASYEYAPVDDDYYYEMIALYGFERFGLNMTVEQLGEIWKEYRAGSWGSSEQTRLLLNRGIKAPMTGHPRYNRWFHTIGPQFSSDIYGMVSPGMVNLAGKIARTYSHVNGYAEGSDGAVFVAACVSEAFFETNTVRIVRQAAQLIDPKSNYRKAIDQVLEGYAQGKDWRTVARESELRWRPDYPQMNNSVANGALVALALLYGEGDYLKSLNIVTQVGDFTDADCNAANVGSVVGAMRGMKAIPVNLAGALNDRIYGDHMGPVKFDKVIDEKISDLVKRIAALGQKNVLANGASLKGEKLSIPRQTAQPQPLEYFDINEYGTLWNSAWKLEGAARGGPGATYLDGDVLVTYPRDTRPCRLESMTMIPAGSPQLVLQVAAEPSKPWHLSVYVDDDRIEDRRIDAGEGGRELKWTEVKLDLGKYAGRSVDLRAYHYLVPDKAPGSAYWKSIQIQ